MKIRQKNLVLIAFFTLLSTTSTPLAGGRLGDLLRFITGRSDESGAARVTTNPMVAAKAMAAEHASEAAAEIPVAPENAPELSKCPTRAELLAWHPARKHPRPKKGTKKTEITLPACGTTNPIIIAKALAVQADMLTQEPALNHSKHKNAFNRRNAMVHTQPLSCAQETFTEKYVELRKAKKHRNNLFKEVVNGEKNPFWDASKLISSAIKKNAEAPDFRRIDPAAVAEYSAREEQIRYAEEQLSNAEEALVKADIKSQKDSCPLEYCARELAKARRARQYFFKEKKFSSDSGLIKERLTSHKKSPNFRGISKDAVDEYLNRVARLQRAKRAFKVAHKDRKMDAKYSLIEQKGPEAPYCGAGCSVTASSTASTDLAAE